MNASQLRKLGVPEECLAAATAAIQSAAKDGTLKKLNVKQFLRAVVAEPEAHVTDQHFGSFAQAVLADRQFVPAEPIEYRTWGSDIDHEAHHQMQQACALPMARGAALMPDAHVGYGLPIGGVLALEGAVVPYAVGVDIACRMKISVLRCSTFRSGRSARSSTSSKSRSKKERDSESALCTRSRKTTP
jgi:tRNA-splicing ligase RtcB